MHELSWDTPTTRWVGQLEWPQEVVGLLEVWTNGVDLVDQVLHTDNTELAESLLNDGVLAQWDSLLVDLTVTSLVHQLLDGGEGWVTVSNVWLNELQELGSGLGELDKDGSVDLQQSQQLQHFSWFRWDLVDTLDSDNEDELWLSSNVVRTSSLGLTLGSNDGTVSLVVLLLVSSSSLEDSLTLLLVDLLGSLLVWMI